MLDTVENPRVHIGANHPPADKPDTFGAIVAHFDSLWEESLHWFDGAAIESDAQASKVQELLRMWQEAAKAADDARKADNKPFDDGKAAVQERYAPLIAETKAVTGKAPKAITACKGALTAWLRKKEQERQAEAKRLADAAEAAAKAAREATQAAHAENDLGAIEAAEQTIADARNAQIAARRVEATSTRATGMGRAVGLRDNWVATLSDRSVALKHYIATDPESLADWLLERGRQDVRAGRRTIPGFTIENQPVAA